MLTRGQRMLRDANKATLDHVEDFSRHAPSTWYVLF